MVDKWPYRHISDASNIHQSQKKYLFQTLPQTTQCSALNTIPLTLPLNQPKLLTNISI